MMVKKYMSSRASDPCQIQITFHVLGPQDLIGSPNMVWPTTVAICNHPFAAETPAGTAGVNAAAWTPFTPSDDRVYTKPGQQQCRIRRTAPPNCQDHSVSGPDPAVMEN